VIEEKDLSGESLAGAVGALVAAPERLARMEDAARGLGRPDAAARVAELLLETNHRGTKTQRRTAGRQANDGAEEDGDAGTQGL
jgi:hypothetical protein